MLKLLIAVVVIVLIFIMLFFMSIQVKLKTIKKDKDDMISVEIRTFYGLMNLKLEVPMLDITFSKGKPALRYKAKLESPKKNKLYKSISKVFSPKDFGSLKELINRDTVLIDRIKDYWLERLIVNEFCLELSYGILDAALAAIIYGLLWTVLGTAAAIIDRKINLNIKKLEIKPYFDRELFKLELSCIIKFKFGDIINTLIIVVKRLREKKKLLPA
jgi:hypothetical protein